MLFGCIHVPDFPVQAALCHESLFHELKKQPVALLDGPDSLLKVVACNDLARDAGVTIGMTKLQAEVCPGVSVRKRIQAHEDSAQAALLECAYHFSPRVEATSAGTIIVDLAGTQRLLGNQKAVSAAISHRVAEQGFESNVSIASNPDAALCAARGFRGIIIISAGDEARQLSSLPIEILVPEPKTLAVLYAWGIRDFKSLAALPSIPLTERLGQYGLHLQRLAQGAVMRELIPAESPAVFQECAELEEPVELLEPLSFILNRLLEQLISRLVTKSLATDQIEIELSLEIHCDRDVHAMLADLGEALHRKTIKLPVPTQDAKVLLKLLQLELAAHPPHAPIKKIKIEAIPARIRHTQAGLFQPLAPEPAQLEVTLARLRAVVGEKDADGKRRVGFPSIVDSHRPDSFQVLPASDRRNDRPLPVAVRLALRMFRQAIPLRIELNAKQVPVWIGFERKRGTVIHAAGPWRGSGQCWDATGEWLRDEWDVHVKLDGRTALYRVYCDLHTGKWFVEGMYD
jgi:protein ImuB